MRSAKERGYKNRDEINVSKAGLGDLYEEKIKGFFRCAAVLSPRPPLYLRSRFSQGTPSRGRGDPLHQGRPGVLRLARCVPLSSCAWRLSRRPLASAKRVRACGVRRDSQSGADLQSPAQSRATSAGSASRSSRRTSSSCPRACTIGSRSTRATTSRRCGCSRYVGAISRLMRLPVPQSGGRASGSSR